MNPWELDATGLMIWGLVAHLIADWPLQNEWMALNKMKRRMRERPYPWNDGTEQVPGPWWDRHPAAYVHAGSHGVLLALVFGWVAVPLALVHLVIDCRWPVEKWSQLVRQTQPTGKRAVSYPDLRSVPVVDIGLEVRFWNDQVFHIICIAIAALIVA